MVFEKSPLTVDSMEQHLPSTVKLVKPRRSHCKSRNGCLHCKQRRVKCDERHPVCGPCTKRQLSCSFQDQNNQIATRRPSETPSRQSISPVESILEDSEIPDEFVPSPYRSVRAMEMKLLHYYSTETYKSLVTVPIDKPAVQFHLPELAFIYPFLMDSLFTITAQHLATVEKHRSKIWIRISLQYQSRTIEKFTRTLKNIDSENCSAVALCSILINLASIASSTSTSENSFTELVNELLNARYMNHGVKSIFAKYYPQLTTAGPLKEWFTYLFSNMLDIQLTPEPDYGQKYQLSPGQKLIYCDLLKSLGYLLNFLERNPMPKQKSYITTCELLAKNLSSQSLRGLTVCALSWPSLIDIHALQPIESDIISRSIFLHYGVVLYMNNNKWYTHGAGQRMMKQMMWNSAETPFEELNSIVMWMRDIIES
ncbi:putative c6 zinc finger domain protein [Erysiphe neolycopersici]|uniref:Putative c6 zinc finger domain protein n=1 Tax=Erysiphe neolycopersici TaxID=212602 RepID=A0A420HSW0_9PEZI|nr:putative c6 zinc finger domain protein [Erysiphe neolycopersici]